MNVDTGELMRLMNEQDIQDGFTKVPCKYSEEAESYLVDHENVFVNMQTSSPLVNWAKKEKRRRKNTIVKSNNPSNLDSLAAKESGLSYWEYMEKTYKCVHHYVWGSRKETKAQKRAFQATFEQAMARSTNPRMRFLSQMRNLLGGRSY